MVWAPGSAAPATHLPWPLSRRARDDRPARSLAPGRSSEAETWRPRSPALRQFVGERGWDAATFAEHRRLIDQALGEDDAVLIVDESAVPIRGDHAGRQGYTLLDRRLHLPRE